MTLPLLTQQKKTTGQQGGSAIPLLCFFMGLCLCIIMFGSNTPPTLKPWAAGAFVALVTGQLVCIMYLHFKSKRAKRRKKEA
jgi:Flp pilus assembly protein TadB